MHASEVAGVHAHKRSHSSIGTANQGRSIAAVAPSVAAPQLARIVLVLGGTAMPLSTAELVAVKSMVAVTASVKVTLAMSSVDTASGEPPPVTSQTTSRSPVQVIASPVKFSDSVLSDTGVRPRR